MPDVDCEPSSCTHRALLKAIAGEILDSGGVTSGDYDSPAIYEDVKAELERLKAKPSKPKEKI
jgi:hypothetical protein